MEEPLSKERVRALEPLVNFMDLETDDAGVYYFADEGHVDPHEAVRALRREAVANGANFVTGRRVVGLVRNELNRVVGVTTTSSSPPDDGAPKNKTTTTTIMEISLADVVVVAAGANSSDVALGGVPLVHHPSRTYFATPSTVGTAAGASLSSLLDRTLVVTIQKLYIAQRKDWTVVAGGGYLKFGLSASATSSSDEISPEKVREQMT